MPDTIYDQLTLELKKSGAQEALKLLCSHLEASGDYHKLFYALLSRARAEKGLCAIPTSPSSDVPPSLHQQFEEDIRNSARKAATLFLAKGDLEQAWQYFKMIGETEPIRAAIDALNPGPEDDIEAPVRLAFYEGLNMPRGFDWILQRYGMCNAITTLSSQDFAAIPAVREYCLQKLLRALYEELAGRIAAEIERREGKLPQIEVKTGCLRNLMAGRDWLFEEDAYHIDLSHLSSTVQMSIHLPPGEELDLARELCDYGARLSEKFLGRNEPPFDKFYLSYGKYLDILAGREVEAGLDYYRQIVRENEAEGSTYPAEVLLQILERIGKEEEALSLAGKTLTASGLFPMCAKAKNFQPLADAARRQEDPVHFLAALIEQGKQKR
ncbi:MAG: hypothetical protein EXR99_11890 [Gemmataceae bacterium]|nr:hypothetical protein [Gemmataceae bacterium]